MRLTASLQSLHELMSAPPDHFETLLEELENRRSDYVMKSPNWMEGQALLSAIQDIKYTCSYLIQVDDDQIEDQLWFHVFYYAVVPDYLEACYLVIDHNLYRLSRMHYRYLFEVWLLLKGLNEDSESAVEIYENLGEEELDSRDWIGDRPSTATPFWKIVKDLRKDVPEEIRDLFWNHPSWEVVHPQSIVSLWTDTGYNEGWEKRYLNGTLMLAFLTSTQFMRGFEGTELEDDLREGLEPLFDRVKMVLPGEPRVPEEDLRYW